MKKIILFLLIAIIMTTPLFSFNDAEAESEIQTDVLAERIDDLTKEFCNEFKDRTSFTEKCYDAAQGIKNFLSGNDKLNVAVQEFSKTVMVAEGLGYVNKDITSWNVIASLKEKDKNKKTIIFTTNFANHYSLNVASNGLNAEGALYNGATTALLLALSEELTKATSEYNYMFAFFSGTDEGNFGSKAFADEYLSQDIILVVNFERLGYGKSYFYTDEVETEHGKFIRDFAQDYDLEEFPSVGRVILDMETVDGLPYSNYAIRGDLSTFMSLGKSCLELIGGDFSGLLDGETVLSNSSLDTYENLVKYYPDYNDRLAAVGRFVIDLTAKSELGDVCLGSASSYKIFTQGWVANVICLGIIILLILIMILVIRHFEKKYPLPAAPKIKVAVFGREYEDINDNDIIIDIKKSDNKSDNNGDDNNPFDI